MAGALAVKLRTARRCGSCRGGRVGGRGAKTRRLITGTGRRVKSSSKGERPAQAEKVVLKKTQTSECTGRFAGAHHGGLGDGSRRVWW